jgi:Mn2+/Fe2+ NRAMP family transporter
MTNPMPPDTLNDIGVLMGVLANRRMTTVIFWCVTALIIALNLFLLYQILLGGG